jgi:hypothetical protein
MAKSEPTMTEIFRQCKGTPEGQAATHLKHSMSPSEEESKMEGGLFNTCRSLQAIPPGSWSGELPLSALVINLASHSSTAIAPV